ncbi:hypothetical protein BSKO_07467 [Bryopsis sp. KO-2023]|nr:hypothetical protein BSKO_07467 [Bryopsis sp. KO-2023]
MPAIQRGSRSSSSFTFHLSCDLDIPVRVTVVSLTALPSHSEHATTSRGASTTKASAVYAVAQICDGGEVLGLEMQTRFVDTGQDGSYFGERLEFCVKYKDLPDTAQLAITVFELAEGKGVVLVGGATMSLFNKRGRLKTGVHKLALWLKREADRSTPSSTPGKAPISQRGESGRLQNLRKKYLRGDVPQVDWLDKLTFREAERIEGLEKENRDKDMQRLELVIQLPRFLHDVLYQGPQRIQNLPPQKEEAKNGAQELPDANLRRMMMIMDPVGTDNPVENKAQKLARHVVGGAIDRDLKPDVQERDRLTAVLNLPPNKPVPEEEKVLLWRFRGSLVSEKEALTKFLKCVDWSDAQEAREAAELMDQWAQIDIADALELLSPDFKNHKVRAHAITVLERADDEELLSYLLQLVQALRYEAEDESQLAEFLSERAARNPRFGFFFHWLLFTEWQDPTFGPRASSVQGQFVEKVLKYPHGAMVWDNIRRQIEMVAQLQHISKELKTGGRRSDKRTAHLREMLSENGSCGELTTLRVPLPVEPTILLTGLIAQECGVFKSAMFPLKLTFSAEENDMDVFFMRGTGSQGGSRGEGDGSISPKRKPHCLVEGNRCVLIYKKGDDLRQDQFTVQMFSLMNRLLLKENLDLKLTIYQVLPTSADDGFVEFVGSSALASILSKHKTIQKYLQGYHPDPNGPFGLEEEVLNTFVKSCAGYCVMTYILGIGDRHLDNLMLTSDGRLFHIDFGYILGRDPKPLPPPMKLCKEMVEAMGGPGSSHYITFQTYCSEAYNILRKKANLILSLFHLMAGASIPDISVDPEKAMLKVQERLALHLDDEAAVQYMQQLINESASALMPQIMEATHRWAQYWKQ